MACAFLPPGEEIRIVTPALTDELELTDSAWGSSKSGDIISVLTKEEIEAWNENPPKKGGKQLIDAYVLIYETMT